MRRKVPILTVLISVWVNGVSLWDASPERSHILILCVISSFPLDHRNSWHLVFRADPPVRGQLATPSGSAVQWLRQQRHGDGKAVKFTQTHEQAVAKKNEEGQPHNY